MPGSLVLKPMAPTQPPVSSPRCWEKGYRPGLQEKMVLEAWTLLMGASTELEVDFHVNFLKSLTELLPNYTSEHEVRQMGCVWMFSGDRE